MPERTFRRLACHMWVLIFWRPRRPTASFLKEFPDVAVFGA